ncbi:DUF1080 domain-containing protein [candidate division KSB1 bacterium]|nr:DUF1080 domain-containing protein [candidate division KSB1 bacterium]
MLRKSLLFLIVMSSLFTLASPQEDSKLEESRDGWVSLFDGLTLDHWQSSTKDELIPLCWKIENEELASVRQKDRPANAHASLVSKEQFSNFELAFEFKLEKPARGRDTNSGVKYFVYPGTELGLEYQLYATTGAVQGPHAIADLYDILPANGAQLSSFDEWNSARIVAQGAHCEHWLNGIKVLEFERGSELFRAAIAKSKFKNRKNFGELEAGHIMLQDHGGGIRFRNIKVREF